MKSKRYVEGNRRVFLYNWEPGHVFQHMERRARTRMHSWAMGKDVGKELRGIILLNIEFYQESFSPSQSLPSPSSGKWSVLSQIPH